MKHIGRFKSTGKIEDYNHKMKVKSSEDITIPDMIRRRGSVAQWHNGAKAQWCRGKPPRWGVGG
jgi:hypothetical protein